MGVEALGLIDVGDRVLHRVPAEEEALLGEPDDRRVVAVDVDLDQLDLGAAEVEALGAGEGAVGRTSGSIGGGPSSVPASIAAAGLEQLGAGGREDLAVAEGLVAGDVVEVPVAEQDRDLLDPALLQRPPDEAPRSTETWVS